MTAHAIPMPAAAPPDTPDAPLFENDAVGEELFVELESVKLEFAAGVRDGERTV